MLLDFDILKVVSNNIKPGIGKILVSEPLLDDPYFKRSAVLIAEEFKNSHFGFILNLKSEMMLRDFVDGFQKTGLPLYLGGPVDTDILYYIHSFESVPDSHKISDGLFLNGDIDEIRHLVNENIADEKKIKFFLGNSGWSPGQLNEEIAFNSWLVSNIPSNFVFSDETKMWEKAIDLLGKRYQIWKNFPLNPDLN